MSEKFTSPALDESQDEKRARTGQGDNLSHSTDFEKERTAAVRRMDRSGSPAVPYASRIVATMEARAGGKRAEISGEDVGPVKSVPVPDPTAVGVPYVADPVRPGFIPEGLDAEDVLAGRTEQQEENEELAEETGGDASKVTGAAEADTKDASIKTSTKKTTEKAPATP